MAMTNEKEFFDSIHCAIVRARSKHPRFVTPFEGEFQSLTEEIGEIANATAAKNFKHRRAEILDAIAVLARMYFDDGNIFHHMTQEEKDACI